MISEKILSLANDEIHLTDKESAAATIVKGFAVVILEKNGTLCVIPETAKCDSDNVIYKNVVLQDDAPIPQGCVDTMFFGLETQVLFVSRKNLASTSRVAIDSEIPESAGLKSWMPTNVLNVANDQAVIYLTFRNNTKIVIIAAKSDCDVFDDVLSDRALTLTFDSNNTYTVTDAETLTAVPNHRVSPSVAKAAMDMFRQNGCTTQRGFFGAPRFREMKEN